MSGQSGRATSRQYRTNRRAVLQDSDLCHLCGHHGAQTTDHLITPREWLTRYGTHDGVDDPANLAPAHGTMQPGRLNRCMECVALGQGGLCNQQRNDKPLTPSPRSRNWYANAS